ncbi:sensor domain-containing diguanylate cyclase [Quadrisphaera setariae]|uniref:Diguanylate cyclase n=1 Tax=Quadrisphaera setariae TaxID=2593304 RepID=A0A5C8ZLJ1_9ACTN|nr:sensor domain-containing diguanylate cyclase [Quadrisphaera setariae]TXR57978.1 diguanylate cyclase [Quadrisphaera setariae]
MVFEQLQEPEGLRERQRLLLAECDLLEPDDDADLAAAARVAAALTGYPVAMVNALLPLEACSLARQGDGPVAMVREESLCHRASLVGGPVVSGDCTTDPLFADLPWVDGRLGAVRRYAMAPLQVDGLVVGTLCVLHEEPGDALGEEPLARLVDLAAMTSSLLERRREARRARAAREEHEQARAFDAALLQSLPVGVAAADAHGHLTHFNDAVRDWYGAPADADAAAGPDDSSAHFELFEADGATPLAPARVPLQRVFTEGSVTGQEYVLRRAGAPPRTLSGSGTQVRDSGGRLLGAVVVLSDVTEQRALEAQLRCAATHDALTGLPHRALLVEQLERALSQARSDGRAPSRVAVLYCDLDGFKAVNDGHGHAAGDAVLLAVAGRLSAALRPQDLVARLGGDEFVLVCPGVADAAEADGIAARLAREVSAPVVVDGVELRVGVSVGVELSEPGEGGEGVERLLSAADASMYARKRERREQRAGV